jgi:hypothetical protein
MDPHSQSSEVELELDSNLDLDIMLEFYDRRDEWRHNFETTIAASDQRDERKRDARCLLDRLNLLTATVEKIEKSYPGVLRAVAVGARSRLPRPVAVALAAWAAASARLP